MSLINNLKDKVTKILKGNELGKVTSDVAEAIFDSELQDGILKDIPILSTLAGFSSAASSIQDALFTKKILYFLKELNSVSQDQRIQQVIKIEDSKEYRTKVGEKILHIIDKCDDLDKAELSGRLFKVYLEGKIDYDQFLSCITCIEKTTLPSLIFFINGDFETMDTGSGGSEFISNGLMELVVSEPKIEPIPKSYEYDGAQKYKIKDFRITCELSPEGHLIREHLL